MIVELNTQYSWFWFIMFLFTTYSMSMFSRAIDWFGREDCHVFMRMLFSVHGNVLLFNFLSLKSDFK
jgi:hypothetical protein